MTIQGNFEGAFSLYDRILEKEPKNVRAVNSKAVALQQAGKNDEALVWYDKALKIDPRDANALYNKACTKALQTSL
jgi:Flp pilus assembly protein TadD